MSDEQFRRYYLRLKQAEKASGKPAQDPFPEDLLAAQEEVLAAAEAELGRPLTDEEKARLLQPGSE